MLQPIDVNLNRVVGHHLGSVAFKVGAMWKNKMDAILQFHFWTLTQTRFSRLLFTSQVVVVLWFTFQQGLIVSIFIQGTLLTQMGKLLISL